MVNTQIQKAPGEWGHLRAGDLKFRDLNGDGVISPGKKTADDPGDMEIIGNSEPRYNYGLNLNASWNGFDVSAFFQGIGRRDWYPSANADKFWDPIRVLISRLLRRILMTWFGLRRIRTHISHC